MANTKVEILRELKPLLAAFEKHFIEEVAELWIEELREFSLEEIRRAVRSFLDSPSQKVFPRIGEFKAATGKEKKEGKSAGTASSSCPRCSYGFCSVRRLVGQYSVPVSFSFRCACPSGNNYPGLPLVSPFERTQKEEVAEKKAAWAAGDSRAG